MQRPCVFVFLAGEKREDQRKPDAFFGYRKVESADHRPRLTIFPQTSFSIIRGIKTERST